MPEARANRDTANSHPHVFMDVEVAYELTPAMPR
jgi:hypothetical protein